MVVRNRAKDSDLGLASHIIEESWFFHKFCGKATQNFVKEGKFFVSDNIMNNSRLSLFFVFRALEKNNFSQIGKEKKLILNPFVTIQQLTLATEK